MTIPADIAHMSVTECVQLRDQALDRLNMSLEEARTAWGDCGCCLDIRNYDKLADLETVKDMDYLLGEGDYA